MAAPDDDCVIAPRHGVGLRSRAGAQRPSPRRQRLERPPTTRGDRPPSPARARAERVEPVEPLSSDWFDCLAPVGCLETSLAVLVGFGARAQPSTVLGGGEYHELTLGALAGPMEGITIETAVSTPRRARC